MELHLLEYWQKWWAITQQSHALTGQYSWEAAVTCYLLLVLLLSHALGIGWLIFWGTEKWGRKADKYLSSRA